MTTLKLQFKILPFVFITTIVLLLILKDISFDFYYHYYHFVNLYKAVLIFGIIGLPLIFLLSADKNFRQQPFHSKLLTFVITSFVAALTFNINFNYIFTIILWISVLFYFAYERKFYRPDTLHILLFIYLIINALSLLWTYKTDKGFDWLASQTVFAYIPLAFCMFRLDKNQFDTILITIFRWMLFFAFLSISCWILESRALGIPLSDALTFTKHLLLGKYDAFNIVFAWSNYQHPTFLAVMMVFGMSIGWYYFGKKQVAAVELILNIAFVLLCSILTQSRFMIVAWLIVNTIFVVYILKTKPKLQIISIVAIALVSMSISFFYPDKIKNLFSDKVRVAHYKVAFEAIKDNPVLGTGLGGMTHYINAYNPIYQPIKDNIIYQQHTPKTEQELATLRENTNLDFIGSNPHNQILGDMMQTGILGLISILSIIIYLIYYTIKKRDWLFGCFTLIFFFLMMIEMPLMVYKGIFIFAFIGCLLIAKPQSNDNTTLPL